MSKSKIRVIRIAVAMLGGLLVLGRAIHIGPRLRLGYQANSILAGATRVETFRVMSPIEAEELDPDHKPRIFSPTAPQVDNCYITATAKEQGPALAEKISHILLNEQTYTSDQLECITLPGVIFRIWKGSQSLDVVLCFHCGEMFIVTHDATGKETHSVYTLMAGNSRSKFAHLAKDAFPNDPDIQAL